jgi:glycosyltransferase involved in cell wall biosynthesis
MAYGVPVIASQVGGLPEMIEHGVSGWLVPPDDPGALAEALAAAAADRERLRSAGLAARERARLFTLERTVELTEALYLRLLSRRESAQSRANLPA